jgi:hypothetical protein
MVLEEIYSHFGGRRISFVIQKYFFCTKFHVCILFGYFKFINFLEGVERWVADDIFPYQKYQFGFILERLRLENSVIF